MIILPVNTFDEAISAYGEKIGIPDIGEFFITIDRRDTFTIERGKDENSLNHSKGTAIVTLFKRQTSVSESIIGLPVAQYFPGGSAPKRSHIGEQDCFEPSFFSKSPNESFAKFDDFTSSGDV